MARNDLVRLVSLAHSLRLYTNLIISGIALNEKKLTALIEAGLDHLQMSFQDGEERFADWIAGPPVHARKLALAGLIRESSGLVRLLGLRRVRLLVKNQGALRSYRHRPARCQVPWRQWLSTVRDLAASGPIDGEFLRFFVVGH